MLDDLRRIVHEVSAAHDLDEALALIVERVKAFMHADVCSVYLNDPETGDHVLMATDGLRPGAVGKVRLPHGQGLTGMVAERAEPLNIEDAPSHPKFRFMASTGEAPFHGFLGVPIISRRKTLGVLVLQQRQTRRSTADDESFLATLAAQLGNSITQAEVRQSLNRLDTGALVDTLFLEGVSTARGLGIGEAVVIFPSASLDSVPDKAISDFASEARRFHQAVDAETKEIKQLSGRLGKILSPGDQALFDAYALLLSSDSLVNGTLERIRAGNWAPGALRATIYEFANIFEEMNDPYLQGRAADIRDLGRRLLYRLLDVQTTTRIFPDQTILAGEEVSVTQFLEIPPEKLVGLMSIRGTNASHVALLARGMGIPAVFGLQEAPLDRLNGRQVVVDGYSGRVCVQPGATLLEEYRRLMAEESELSKALETLRDQPALTPDGQKFKICANSGLFADIAAAKEKGAEGVGLYRSELHFAMRDRFPSEDDQVATYTRALQTMAPFPVTLRTLDVGGDKPLPYYPIDEENPFLGWRGIRFSLDQPDIFKTQLRAMLRAGNAFPNMSIMFPMISGVGELQEVLAMLHLAYDELLEDALEVNFPRVGIMVEVPSAVYLIDKLVPLVDFVSIGSNDLTQYLLAVDRNNDRVAKLCDSLHPAVLWAIRYVTERTHRAAKIVSICGELAGDPAGAILLMGMGVDILSMGMGNLLKIKWVVRTIPHSLAQALLQEALEMDDATAIRARLNGVLEEYGLGGLMRAGR
jgi:phosphotransferase system enzyme I (PtsP)